MIVAKKCNNNNSLTSTHKTRDYMTFVTLQALTKLKSEVVKVHAKHCIIATANHVLLATGKSMHSATDYTHMYAS